MRIIKRDTGKKDNAGDAIFQDVWIDVVRVGIPWQSIIVERRVGFTLSHPVKTEVIWDKETDKEKQLVKLIEKIQNDNKMDYKNIFAVYRCERCNSRLYVKKEETK
jgi:uncharacterized protein with PIN domain